MKWVKSKTSNVRLALGRKFTYAYYVDKGLCKLLVETIGDNPEATFSYVMRVRDIKTARQIAELLEK